MNSIEVLTKKWSEFMATHLDALTGVVQKITELKDLAERLVTGATARHKVMASER